MRTRGGIAVVGAALLLVSSSGCAVPAAGSPSATVAAPTSEASASPKALDERIEAQQRAETWLETTELPPGAVRSDVSTSAAFDLSHVGWVCTPTMTVTAFWTIEGMTPGEALNWMLEHPTPGLVNWQRGPVDLELSAEGTAAGVMPEGDPLQGIAFTYVKVPGGTALRAEVGAAPSSAVCPTPPDGATWGPPGAG